MKLLPQTVSNIFFECLFKEDEDNSIAIESYGVTIDVGFHPERIERHKEKIVNLLNELPLEFCEATGGGFSFLAACNDKNGEQWTGFHAVMEQLFLLGMAAKRVKCLLPRDMWYMLPGSMPYYVVTAKDIKD